MEKMLNNSIQKQLTEMFADIKRPVTLLFFGSKGPDCEYCEQTHQLLTEICSASSNLTLEVYDIDDDSEMATTYKIDNTPAIVICAKDGDRLVDYGIRVYGIPAGHEFGTLVHTIILVSKGESDLDDETVTYLKGLKKPVHLQVFVTPT